MYYKEVVHPGSYSFYLFTNCYGEVTGMNNEVLEVKRKMKKIMKFAALTLCAMFLCVFSFQTAQK